MLSSLRLPGPTLLPSVSTLVTLALTSGDHAIAALLRAPASGSLEALGVLVTSVVGTSPTYRLAVEGVAATRSPDGAVKGGGAAKADRDDLGAGHQWLALDAPLAVDAGELLALTMRYQSGTVSAFNHLVCGVRPTGLLSAPQLPCSATNTGGGWTAGAGFPLLAARYADGRVLRGLGALAGAPVQHTLSSATDPLRMGAAFTPPLRCRLLGAGVVVSATTQTFDLEAWVGSASVAARVVSVDPALAWQGSSGSVAGEILFASPLVCEPGVPVRLVVRPTTSTAFGRFWGWTFADTESRAALAGDLLATDAPPGDVPEWTDRADRQYPVLPVLDQVERGRPRVRIRRAG
ncbi:MAG TPA: hypothetical protein PKC49_05420 [Phycisphaerae bacterium]|nr:hypothetical protein [Phycisphaerae bacterium]